MHIYNWDAWAQKTIPVPMVGRPRVHGRDRRAGLRTWRGLEVGDRVSGEGHITCGHCRNCRAGRRTLPQPHRASASTGPGAFAEYLVIPAAQRLQGARRTSATTIASILDPFGNATHTALRFDLVGEDVLITGAGPIGIMAAAIARHVGARHVVITDVNDYRLELARQAWRAAARVNVRTRDAGARDGRAGHDRGLRRRPRDVGRRAAFHQMLDAMNHGGAIAMLGIPPDR